MQIRIAQDAPAGYAPERSSSRSSPVRTLDGRRERGRSRQLGGRDRRVLASGEIKGKLGEIALVHAKDGRIQRVLAVGLGERAEFEPAYLARYAGTAVRYLGKTQRRRRSPFALPPRGAQATSVAAASFIAEGAHRRDVRHDDLSSEPEKRHTPMTIVTMLAAAAFDAPRSRRARRAARCSAKPSISRAGSRSRPRNDMTPTHLADEARRGRRRTRRSISTCSTKRGCASEGMGSFLGVAQGSAQPREVHRPDATTATRRAASCSRSSARASRSTPAASRSSRPSACKR